ncbi:MAG TPA: glycosyltransferase family 2 protein [Microcella sp.]|nr:glycosyltransferase family 2 protein [Microcella sp.]
MAEPDPTPPGVSYVMPVYNEIHYIDDAIDSVLAQRYGGPTELVLALGPSTDGTTDRVRARAAGDPRIRIVDNPDMAIPIGLNRAIRASRYPIVVRVDAHTELSENYTAQGVETLERTGAASVGGVMVATGRTTFQRAVARGYNSRLGLGGASYHVGGDEGPAESAYLGIMRRDELLDIGLYDENINRGEDWELNKRLRDAGHLVWLNPALRVTYWPRDTWQKLARQFRSTGIWRGEIVRRSGGRSPLRYYAPPALVAASALSLLGVVALATGLLAPDTGPIALAVLTAPTALYVALLVALLVVRSSGETLRERAAFVVVVATMHFAWGAGFIGGALFGARGSVDRSRTES